MARAYAQAVIAAATTFRDIPKRIAQTAWQRTLASLAEMEMDDAATTFSERAAARALQKFQSVFAFCKGDKSQNIYEELIHNENNMRPRQINALFKLSDLKDACFASAGNRALLVEFNEPDPGKSHGLLLSRLEDFFERRNEIAHALNPSRSSGSDQLIKDVSLLEAFGKSLSETLESSVSKNNEMSQVVDLEFIKNSEGTTTEIHSVPIGIGAAAYAKAHGKRMRLIGYSYTIVLKVGKTFDLPSGAP